MKLPFLYGNAVHPDAADQLSHVAVLKMTQDGRGAVAERIGHRRLILG